MTTHTASLPIAGGSFLITGGASLVGSHSAAELLARGAARVRVLDSFFQGSETMLADVAGDPRLEIVRGDVMRLPQLIEACTGIDGVLHLAALMTITMHRDPWTGLDVNIRGTQNLLEAAAIKGVRKVVFASSTAAYGYGPGIVGDLDEGMAFHSAGAPPAAVLYGASKIVGEQLCRDAKAKRGLDYVVLRYATVYGERQHERAANALALIEAHERVKAGLRPQVIGDGSETKHFVHVEDVARANADAFAAEATDVALNISGPAPITTGEIARLIATAAGRADLTPEFVSPDPGKVRLTSGGAWVMPHAKATQLLGWTPRIGMAEGIARLIAWRDRSSRGGR